LAPSRVKTEDLVDDLRSLDAGLAALLERDGDPPEMDVWKVYAGTELVVAKLKARLGFETPGVHFKLPKAKDSWRTLLVESRTKLESGLAALSRGEPVEAVGILREGRNLLRGYLTEKRRAVTRKKPVRVSGQA
jgi:hypothetical protein